MRIPRLSLVCNMLGLVAAATFGSAGAAGLLGTRPAYLEAGPTPAPNAQAISTRIWAPGLNDGFVPQGITFAEGHVLVSSYQSDYAKTGAGSARIYRLDPASGKTDGQFDLPDAVKHAGGIVYAGNGVLIVADTRCLYKIDLARAFADGNTERALLGTIRLGGAVKGSFVDFYQGSILTGAYDKDPAKSKVFFLPYALFERGNDDLIDESAASRSFAITAMGQGAAFDRQGYLWLSFSNSNHGLLQKVDPVSGKVLEQHTMVDGIEDLGFDPQGGLWAVSEAGSPRWRNWEASFPLVFRMDVDKLQ